MPTNPSRIIRKGAATTRRTPPASGLRERLLATVPLSERQLRLNGVSTAVLEGGEGPPVVLLHGPAESAFKWLRVIPDLVATHRVIAPDLPGHGASQAMDGTPDVERVLAWLEDLIECTCATPPTLVGEILGGAIAARFASLHGERIKRLVLVDPLGLAPFQPTPELGEALTQYVMDPNENSYDTLWSRCAFSLDALRDGLGERWQSLRAYNLDRARAPELTNTRHGLMEQFGIPAIPPATLSRIAVPTTLVWGRHNRATPLSVAMTASERFRWTLRVIENAGVDLPLEQPQQFLETLRAALHDAGPQPTARERPDTRAAWDQIAPGYDRTNTPSQMWIANEGLRRAGLRPGMRFLDVASGSGALSIPAARLGASVVAIDQSPVMLELLAARARRERLSVETRVMDGHALELEDNTFDMAGSQFGVMLFPDMPGALREMVRVVKPGGRALIHAYGDPHQIEFIGFFIRAVQSVRPDFDGPPTDPPPLEFQLADPNRLRAELIRVGLSVVTVETMIETTEHETGKGLWEWLVWSNPIVERMLRAMLNLTEEERGVVQQALERLVRERAAGGRAARLTNPVNVGFGTKAK